MCNGCCARKPSKTSNKAPLGRTIVGGAMEKIAMDILGPFPKSDNNNKYVLVVCDEFTKWTEAFPIPNQEAVTIPGVSYADMEPPIRVEILNQDCLKRCAIYSRSIKLGQLASGYRPMEP